MADLITLCLFDRGEKRLRGVWKLVFLVSYTASLGWQSIAPQMPTVLLSRFLTAALENGPLFPDFKSLLRSKCQSPGYWFPFGALFLTWYSYRQSMAAMQPMRSCSLQVRTVQHSYHVAAFISRGRVGTLRCITANFLHCERTVHPQPEVHGSADVAMGHYCYNEPKMLESRKNRRKLHKSPLHAVSPFGAYPGTSGVDAFWGHGSLSSARH